MNDLKRIIIVVLGLSVLCLMTFGIKGHIDSAGYKNQVNYTYAVKADKKDIANYAIDSQQGRVLANGPFVTKTANLAKFDEMTKGFTYVERIKEHYTPHISCSKKSCSTYYTWDYAGSEDRYADTITFYDREYSASLFNMKRFLQDVNACDVTAKNTNTGWFSQKHGCEDEWFGGQYYYIDNDNRYYYKAVPLEFTATFLASTYGTLKPFEENQITLQNKSIDQVLVDVGKYHLIGFWTATILLIMLVIAGICVAYNWVMNDGVWSLDK